MDLFILPIDWYQIWYDLIYDNSFVNSWVEKMSRHCHAASSGLGGGGGHGFSFWNGFSWPWWNILEYFRLDHNGSHDVTHHTSHTESYWVILSYQFISDITLHIISHPYRSTSLAKCTMWHHFSQTHAVPWLPMAENLDMRWSSSASGVARCWRCQRSRRQVQSFRVN
jgi:hypothetical protein